jgi:hypothetical protein
MSRLGVGVPRRIALLARASILAVAAAPAASARVLHVGPGGPYRLPCQAIAAARSGDQIQIDARGSRASRGDVCAWATDRLTGHVRRTDGGTIAGAFGTTGDP